MMDRRSRWLVGAAAAAGLLAIGPSDAAGATVTLQAQQQSLAHVVGSLSEALGAPVRIEGERKAPVSVTVTDVSPREALDAVAAAADGRWQRLYVLSGQGKGGGAGRLKSGRLVTLSLEDVSVATAAGTVARAAGARLELDEVPDRSISIGVESEPVEDVFDRLAKEAELSWRAEYVLTVAEPAPAAAPKPAPAKGAAAVKPNTAARRGTGPAGRGNARYLAGPDAPSGPTTRKHSPFFTGGAIAQEQPADRALMQPSFYRYLFGLPRAQREAFIKKLAEELRTGGAPGVSNPALRGQMMFERRQRQIGIVQLIQTLPNAHRKELKPITDAILGGMQTGTEPGGVGTGTRP